MQVTGTAQGVEISQALEDAVNAGVIANGTSIVNKPNGQLAWTISITDNDGKTTFCTTGDWIVLGMNGDTVTSIALYAGPDSTYNNPPYSTAFTAPGS